jgi:hypothetical protein
VPIGSATVNAWPLLTTDDQLDFDFTAVKQPTCSTTTTLIVGQSVTLPQSAGNQAIQQSTGVTSALVPTLINEETATSALTACTYDIPQGANVNFKTGLGPWLSMPITGSIVLVGLSGDPAIGRSALVSETTIKIDSPEGTVVLKNDPTNPGNQLSILPDGTGELKIAMSVDSEYPYRPGMNDQVFWFVWPVSLNSDGTNLRFLSNGPNPGNKVVPVSEAMAAGFLKAGQTFPRLPQDPTDPCTMSGGNPDMRDRADWIMQGIYGPLNGVCANPYQ